VLRSIFGPKSEEMARNLGRLRNEEFHNLYTSPNVIRVIKSRRMRWAAYVAEMRNAYKVLVRKPEGLGPL
jgi:hypothetical protein